MDINNGINEETRGNGNGRPENNQERNPERNMAKWEETAISPAPIPAPNPTPTPSPSNNPFALNRLLESIEAIINNNSHITEAIQRMAAIAEENGVDADMMQIASTGLTNIVAEREKTNRDAIRFLERAYEESSPKPQSDRLLAMGVDVNDLLLSLPPDEKMEFLRGFVF